MARHLVYFAHPGAAALPAYAAALAKLGDVDIVPVHRDGRSRVYVDLAGELRGADGRILPGLQRRYPPPHSASAYATLSILSYSAGYALARAILAVDADRAAIDAYVAIDSIYASSERSDADAQLQGFVELARAAKAGASKIFWLGHTELPTTGFASTSQVAAWIRELAGGEGGGFVIRSFTLHGNTEAEHAAALTEWGPAFAAEALSSLAGTQ